MSIDFDCPHILVTGGAGFVGARLAIRLKEFLPELRVTAFDNLRRRGSEMNIAKLNQAGVVFHHGDVRNYSDLAEIGPVGLIVECSAEPSILSGYENSPNYVIDCNLVGSLNCLELAQRNAAGLIFLSTSRVYSIKALQRLAYENTPTRYELADEQTTTGASRHGISTDFPLNGPRSIYGATKLAAEIMAIEYADAYSIPVVVNRCGVIAGPGQFGKADQGVFSQWLLCHYFNRPLSYIGWGGSGKQVRDILHVDDLADLIILQVQSTRSYSGMTFNAGGGHDFALSLLEATQLCQSITGNSIPIAPFPDSRRSDVPVYITDNRAITQTTGWKPGRPPAQVLTELYEWVRDNEDQIRSLPISR